MPKLMRACSTVAADGMVLYTDSERVKKVRAVALELLMSDHEGDCKGPCTLNCPAGTDCQGYVKQIALGNDREAVKIIKDKLPLPASIGRACPHPCETACRRTKVEEPISIAFLKYFAADRVLADNPYIPQPESASGKKVAVIGGGLGTAIAYPQAKKLHDLGADVTVITGFRNKELIILEDELKAIANKLIVATDDGSNGTQGFVTDMLEKEITSKPKVYLFHGTNDFSVQYKTLGYTKDWLSMHDIDWEAIEYEGIEHRLIDDEMFDTADFLNE
jgi:hypothetical protein